MAVGAGGSTDEAVAAVPAPREGNAADARVGTLPRVDVRGDLSVDQQGTIVVRDGIGRLTPALAKVLFGRHGFVIQRPVYPDRAETFPLAVMRTGPPSDLPVLFIPGGPGMGSVLPYVGLRATATQHGLDAIMVEHRGVGLSRRDNRGRDLPLDAVTLEAAADDLAAVVQDVA